MQNRYLYSLRIVLASIDFLCINLIFAVAYYAAFPESGGNSVNYYLELTVINSILWVVNVLVLHRYHNKAVYRSAILFSLRWQCGFIHLVVFAVYLVLTGQLAVCLALYLLFFLFLGIHFICSQLTYRIAEPLLKTKYRFKKPIALLGISKNSEHLASFLQSTHRRYDLANFLEQHECRMVSEAKMSLPATCEQIKAAANKGITDVYVAINPDTTNDEIEVLMIEAHNQCIRLKLIPQPGDAYTQSYSSDHITQLHGISAFSEPLEDMNNRFVKRMFDLIVSAGVILFVFTWLYPILAVLIKLQSPGPVLFTQLRSGKNNRQFLCYKFRSMTVNMDADDKQATKGDGRITSIGRFMRKTSIDEFPQFFNVLLGNMSVVGPRPHMLKHTEQYRNTINKYMVRHYLKPGITGWAQINGFRGETKEAGLMIKRVEHDIWYLEKWSIALDLKIIFLTVVNIFKGESNAY
ncbi:exopolysaccharide biosynthesis polyprenyl glycosylphosphotransferase [Mucilaginibacter sp. Bleaf8]|uniref:exopolysaccharide biosynthesis polyprenyl glycosylphosphotransferase n=1 Tax=Mucilaginibacter sp. Bleaf8 TaxID=2834430 RepID=UPI001BCD34F3|nr:exopolysaccharide biosynthesis polyprenyl glycosylphosphotransferase [Mucilaginibacter sp. Bleaf8]MBS7566808.1 exopolysaccharide biosynthesis polyprenyl glycosylphosphotransferase [Mucilaginibacter sp. Bleaf8]